LGSKVAYLILESIASIILKVGSNLTTEIVHESFLRCCSDTFSFPFVGISKTLGIFHPKPKSTLIVLLIQERFECISSMDVLHLLLLQLFLLEAWSAPLKQDPTHSQMQGQKQFGQVRKLYWVQANLVNLAKVCMHRIMRTHKNCLDSWHLTSCIVDIAKWVWQHAFSKSKRVSIICTRWRGYQADLSS